MVRFGFWKIGERGMKLAGTVVAIAVLLGCAFALADEGLKWQTDKYKTFSESTKKGRLLFLYYWSTS